MALFEAEFIDADGAHLVEGNFAIEKLQPFLMNVFDQIPANPEIFGYRAARTEPEHVEHCQSKRSNKAVSSYHKGKCRPPQRRARPAFQTVDNELQHALLASYGTHIEPPAFLTFEAQIPATTLLTPDPLMVHLGAEDDPVGHEVRGSVLNTLQPKSMVKYRRGHGCGLLRIVRLASNKNGTLPCPFLFFNYPGARLLEDPHLNNRVLFTTAFS